MKIIYNIGNFLRIFQHNPFFIRADLFRGNLFLWVIPHILISFSLIADHDFSKNKPEVDLSICEEKEEFVETKHRTTINGELLEYKAIAGTLLIKDEKCKPKANIFYVSYLKEGNVDCGKRPISFCFNGGPGASSVWLHLGVLGPKKVYLDKEGSATPPYCLVDNEYSLLDATDLVFIDPVSTGFSRAIPVEDAKQYHSFEEDVKIMAEFIRLYITRYQRWESPRFIVGESYGTIRATSLAAHLHDRFYINVSGIVLISTMLNFQSIDFTSGNDISYQLILPSYTATAWYHRKLPAHLQSNLQFALQQSQNFAGKEYAEALFKGDLLSLEEGRSIENQLAQLTGLSPEYISRSNLRISSRHFLKELLRNEGMTLGRFDSRLKGIDFNQTGEYADYDPSMVSIFGAFHSAFNQYLQTDLKWIGEGNYKVLAKVTWDYGVLNQYLNVSQSLSTLLQKYSYLKVFVASGYYDLATPYFANDYTFNHLNLDQPIKNSITMKYYDAGHMMYTDYPSLIKLKKDLFNFYQQTLFNSENSKSIQL